MIYQSTFTSSFLASSVRAMFFLGCSLVNLGAEEIWKSEKGESNFHLEADYSCEKGSQVVVRSEPGVSVPVKLAVGSSGKLEVGVSQRVGEKGMMKVWLDGKAVGDVREFAGVAKGGGGENGARFVSDEKQASELFAMGGDFSVMVKFRTKEKKGSLVAMAQPGKKWLRGGKVLMIRGGKLVYDIGWLGEISGGGKVNDGKWHEVCLLCRGSEARLFLDGKEVAKRKGFTMADPKGGRFLVGEAGTDFGGTFQGEIVNVRFWKRALKNDEAVLASGGKVDETNTPDFNWKPQKAEKAVKQQVEDGFVKHQISIIGEGVKLTNVKLAKLAEADHAMIASGLGKESYQRGEKIYKQLCITCHGTDEQEGSLPTALKFHEGEFKNGHAPFSMYQTLTKGYGQMVPQAWMTAQQKWDVIHFIREAYLKEKNPKAYAKMDSEYLASLPRGIGLGPKKENPFDEDSPKWKKMNYGPAQFWTMQVGEDNIAYKGIAVRLDEGLGGVSQGKKWMLYDHDTMRVAAAWEGEGYIDWKGIAFDQSHGTHSSIVGDVVFTNPVGPGWANPRNGSFEDPRFLGRDGKPYGPLPRDWVQYKGMYLNGNQVMLEYEVGHTGVTEIPAYEMLGGKTIFVRHMQIWKSENLTKLRVAPDHMAVAVCGDEGVKVSRENGEVFIEIQPKVVPCQVKIFVGDVEQTALSKHAKKKANMMTLSHMRNGGVRRWPETVVTEGKKGSDDKAFAVDEISLPHENPWNSWMRLGGFDFFADGKRAAVATWLGDVFIVDGIEGDLKKHRWQRIATGLFQPLGVKIVDEKIYVTCRDQIALLHDLNGDEEIDYIESFNNDHQVTEHFHEFAMGLQTDENGNFYYAKSARHAKTAIVPHHGTLLRVSADGSKTEIVANGFRAANGVCLNPDGTFIVTDQEGHWNPKNRINYVKEGGFYGNMFGYHSVKDESDEAMDQPLCWITNKFDRSPGELMWVPAKANWGPLNGKLLNLSYGMGRIFLVPHEKIDGQAQGGMISLGMDMPTGMMRGRFHPGNGQLYATGMFAWAGNKKADGAFYRIRYTGKNPNLPVTLKATKDGVKLGFSCGLDRGVAGNGGSYEVEIWDLKRTKSYGSKHYNTKKLKVEKAVVSDDGKTVRLFMPELKPTWGMSIKYRLKSEGGESFEGEINNSIHQMGKE